MPVGGRWGSRGKRLLTNEEVYKWGSWNSERWWELPKVPWPTSSLARIGAPVSHLPDPTCCSPLHWFRPKPPHLPPVLLHTAKQTDQRRRKPRSPSYWLSSSSPNSGIRGNKLEVKKIFYNTFLFYLIRNYVSPQKTAWTIQHPHTVTVQVWWAPALYNSLISSHCRFAKCLQV